MAKETLTFRTIIKQADQELSPAIPDMVATNCITNIPNKVTIAKNTTDFILKLDDNANSDMRMLALVTDPKNGSKLTCKCGSSTKVDKIAPFQVYSEDFSQVLISNSDTTNDLVVWVFDPTEESS